MCGIAGILGGKRDFYHSGAARTLIEEMTSSLQHRGPDDNGIVSSPEHHICIGHRRLAIQDISAAGAQPMSTSCGNYVLSYNGEIYNHLELRTELEKTHQLQWNGFSDTETLITLISLWGIERALKSIVGMFAFALWDKRESKLILARDRFGEKPLYYTKQDDTFLFASELKAIECYPRLNKEINKAAVQQFLSHKFIPAPLSIWKDVYKLRPATYLIIDTKNLNQTEKTYWDSQNVFLEKSLNPTDQSPIEIQNTVEELLSRTVQQQMISDVPLGSFLSGGIDSSLITMLMQRESSKRINTFSIGVGDSQFNESAAARKIASTIGTNHTEFNVEVDDVLAVIPEMNSMYDEPFSDSSQLVTYLVSKLAKEHVTVALTGDAGDEFFCGYNRYMFARSQVGKLTNLPRPLRGLISRLLLSIPLPLWSKFIGMIDGVSQKRANHVRLPEKIVKIAQCLQEDSRHGLYGNFVSDLDKHTNPCKFDTTEPFNFESICGNEEVPLTDYLMYADSQFYLPGDILNKTDRASMATSLETRSPFLDHRLVEYAWAIPTDQKLADGKSKSILRNILYKKFDKSVIDRPKMGFAVPMNEWLKGPLAPLAEKHFSNEKLASSDYLDSSTTTRLWNEHKSGRSDHHSILWSILSFQIWHESHLN